MREERQNYKKHKVKNQLIIMAGWQSGYAAACKAVYAGSIPASASNTWLEIIEIKMSIDYHRKPSQLCA